MQVGLSINVEQAALSKSPPMLLSLSRVRDAITTARYPVTTLVAFSVSSQTSVGERCELLGEFTCIVQPSPKAMGRIEHDLTSPKVGRSSSSWDVVHRSLAVAGQ